VHLQIEYKQQDFHCKFNLNIIFYNIKLSLLSHIFSYKKDNEIEVSGLVLNYTIDYIHNNSLK